jgi:hypothetical protein
MKNALFFGLVLLAAGCGTHHGASDQAPVSPETAPTTAASPPATAAKDAAPAMVAKVRLDAAGNETEDVSYAFVAKPAQGSELPDAFAQGEAVSVTSDLQDRADE